MNLNRKNTVFLIVLISSLLSLLGGSALSASSSEDVLKARMTTLWVDGQLLGDMVLGATSQLTFLYMDGKACDLAEKERAQLPDWIAWNLQYRGNASSVKKGFFLIRYKALKNWDFDISKISIGGYTLTKDDIFTKSEFVKSGSLPSGTEGTLAVGVPGSYLKPGKKISISYGDWSEQWIIPKR
ncbi:MAG: hypothetical protein EOM02_04525 [Synergistales bacterium]|nr:hypothetical protein [Synergistales bacterium]